MLHFLDFNNCSDTFSFNYSFLWMKDIATRVIAREVNLEDTPVSKVMTKNPIFVISDTLAVEALQKMVQGLGAHPILFTFSFIFLKNKTFCILIFEHEPDACPCRKIQTFACGGERGGHCFT